MILLDLIKSVGQLYDVKSHELSNIIVNSTCQFGPDVFHAEVTLAKPEKILDVLSYYGFVEKTPAPRTGKMVVVETAGSILLLDRKNFAKFVCAIVDIKDKCAYAPRGEASNMFKSFVNTYINSITEEEFQQRPSFRKALVSIALEYLLEAGFASAEDAFTYVSKHSVAREKEAREECCATTNASCEFKNNNSVRVIGRTMFMPDSLCGETMRANDIILSIAMNLNKRVKHNSKIRVAIGDLIAVTARTNLTARIDKLSKINNSMSPQDHAQDNMPVLYIESSTKAYDKAVATALYTMAKVCADLNESTVVAEFGFDYVQLLSIAKEVIDDSDFENKMFECITTDLLALCVVCCDDVNEPIFSVLSTNAHNKM